MKKTKVFMIIGATVIILGIGSLGVYFAQKNNTSDSGENPTVVAKEISKETKTDGSVVTTLSDGTTVEKATDGTTIERATDGSVKEVQADGTVIVTQTDGSITETKVDGTVILTKTDGSITQTTTNGTTKEIQAPTAASTQESTQLSADSTNQGSTQTPTQAPVETPAETPTEAPAPAPTQAPVYSDWFTQHGVTSDYKGYIMEKPATSTENGVYYYCNGDGNYFKNSFHAYNSYNYNGTTVYGYYVDPTEAYSIINSDRASAGLSTWGKDGSLENRANGGIITMSARPNHLADNSDYLIFQTYGGANFSTCGECSISLLFHDWNNSDYILTHTNKNIGISVFVQYYFDASQCTEYEAEQTPEGIPCIAVTNIVIAEK